jgi:hypothetical protein
VDRCVECIATEHCAPRHRCDANECVAAMCEGVFCQGGSACDDQTGRCSPSCEQTGCLDAQECDPETGQCYNSDGSCDVDSPCRPGSTCGAGGFPAPGEQTVNCSCPTNVTECQGPEDCPGYPGGCADIGFCEVLCSAGCPDGWSCGGFLCEADNRNDFCHPGTTCNSFGGTCEGG